MSILQLLSLFLISGLQWHFKTYPTTVSIGAEIRSIIWVNPVSQGTVGYYYDVTSPDVVLKDKKIYSTANGYRIEYVYALFSTTPVVIKDLGFRWIPRNGKEKVYKIPPFKINVKLTTSSHDRPVPPSPFVRVLVFNWNGMILILLLLILASGVLLLRRVFKRREEPGGVQEVVEPPEVIAERRLQELLNSEFFKNKKWKPFFLQLTEIVRDYLAAVFKFSAKAETTFEIVTEMRLKKISSSDLTMIRNFFEKSDLIKFAKYKPSDEEVSELIDFAKKIIKLGMRYYGA